MFIGFCRRISEKHTPTNHEIRLFLHSEITHTQIMRKSSKIEWFLGPIFSEMPQEKSIKIMLLLVLCGVNP